MASSLSARNKIIKNMGQIITLDQIKLINPRLTTKSQSLILVGGCFDILHRGHIMFLEAAKKQGDVLIVILESDESIKAKKGDNRPINSQKTRAQILSHLKTVDYVIELPHLLTGKQYDEAVAKIKPTIIATTVGDPMRIYKERSAKIIGAAVVDVIGLISDESTTKYTAKLT